MPETLFFGDCEDFTTVSAALFGLGCFMIPNRHYPTRTWSEIHDLASFEQEYTDRISFLVCHANWGTQALEMDEVNGNGKAPFFVVPQRDSRPKLLWTPRPEIQKDDGVCLPLSSLLYWSRYWDPIMESFFPAPVELPRVYNKVRRALLRGAYSLNLPHGSKAFVTVGGQRQLAAGAQVIEMYRNATKGK